MLTKTLTVVNPSGFHLRPAGVLCNKAGMFHCRITFAHEGESTQANAKSVLSVLAACVKCGDVITLTCDGEDEEEAMETVSGAILSGLGEE